MKSKFIITIILIGITQSIWAYPTTPRPLRKLVIESEYIVYADVIGIKEIKANPRENNTKAILVIKEVLQGDINQDTIEVYFNANMICPGPPGYKEKTTVLVFLDKQKEGTGYLTHAYSYGLKTLDDIIYNNYKQRIIALQTILKIKNEDKKNAKTIDWLISCAVCTDTRWDGVYEFTSGSDFMRDDKTFVKKYKLNKTQNSILRKLLFSIEQFRYSDIELIDLVAKEKENDKELIAFFIEKLKKMGNVDFLMGRIAELMKRDDLMEIVNQVNQLEYIDEKREEKVTKLRNKFIEKI